MTKAITCTVIGRLIQEGWLASVYDPAPAPLWRDPRSIHRLITFDHLLRMRSGLGFPVSHGDGRVTIGFENSAVYQDAGDAFEAAQRSIVATVPGAVYRTSTAASTCSARSFATRSTDAGCRITRRCTSYWWTASAWLAISIPPTSPGI
jgi:CubicO group peptidase (beta-lactamase class C family)